ncbi:hypothetical protein M9H77_05314 [Catharanthus roseus]|uniref:Uncharacterized protein n=1 Tax=Catharanthus roseus TaxID=4058 RepID=A0ACC0CH66_CATRO|nr:hypothetical protein M9H77_05314 [Catharanthus roseus]
MLSLPRTFNKIPPQISFTSQHHHHPPQFLLLPPIKSSSNETSNGGRENATPPTVTPPDTVEIRFRRGSKRRRNLEQADGQPMKTQPKAAPKDWESMTVTEKATELYLGEKGLLFWLNKFAYASIFIIIGGWIVFRFVGPALNLYQLDSPPLAPTSIFKG